MTKEIISAWFNRLPVGEQDLPLLIVEGIAYTPRMALEEVNRNSPVGQKLQALIERGSFGTTASEEQAVARTRLEQILKSKPDRPMFATLSEKVFTPSQLLREIKQGTSIGQQWTQNEINHMKALVRLR